MGSSVYFQTRHKRIEGLVEAVRAAKCFNCGGLAPAGNMFKGWCLRCVESWKATADPVMIAQVALGYSPSACIPGPSARQVEQITEGILAPKSDAEFLPLLRFLGNPTVGRMQAMWNFVKTMELLEIKSTADAWKLSKASHDVTHRCGLHAPVQITTLNSFFSRMSNAGDAFQPLQRDKHLLDYLRWFIDNNRVFIYTLRQISETSYDSRQAWRRIQRVKWTPLRETWPFLAAEAAPDHDLILKVDAAIPKGIPEQWRQDMCQDLMVAVLAGDVSVENLRDQMRPYITKVWRDHPIKYGPLSLDAPAPWASGDDNRTLGAILENLDVFAMLTCEEHDHNRAGTGEWHEGRGRPTGLSTMEESLRAKHNGRVIEDGALPVADTGFVMDDEIAEIYGADLHPRGYRGSPFAPTSAPKER